MLHLLHYSLQCSFILFLGAVQFHPSPFVPSLHLLPHSADLPSVALQTHS